MPTMSHNKKDRAAWHKGKRKPGEDVGSWIGRVINYGKNYKGAFTPAFMKRGVRYKAK